jgi:hypothetical protein
MTTMLRILGAAILALGISGLVAAHSTLASGTKIGGCSFGALQTDLKAGGDWFYAVGQCPSPIIFDSTITISANASLTAQGMTSPSTAATVRPSTVCSFSRRTRGRHLV